MITKITIFIKSLYRKSISYSKKVNRFLFTIISICVSIAILGFLIYRQWEVLYTLRWQFRPIPILLAFVLFSGTIFWAAIVWGWIMNSLGGVVSYRKHIRYYTISNVAKRIPGTIWYVAGRIQQYSIDGVNKNITAIASGIEMVMIILAGVLIALVASTKSILQYFNHPIILIIVFVIGGLVLHPKVIQWIMTKRKIEAKTFNYFSIIKGILSYMISWVLGGVILFEIGNIIYPISPAYLIYFIGDWVIVGVLSSLLYFSPSNFGITEIGLSLLLSNIIPSSIAVTIAVLARILMTFFEIIWASLFLLLKSSTPKSNNPKELVDS